jgi:drug/metabolite transporter (DMT)-like permease
MSLTSRVMLAVGLLLVAYAALAVAGRTGRDGRPRQSLGCGFALAAGVVWGVALSRYLGDWWVGMRLGIAFAIVLPALVMLARPDLGRLLVVVVVLCAAAVLAVPAWPRLQQRLSPPPAAPAGQAEPPAGPSVRPPAPEVQ